MPDLGERLQRLALADAATKSLISVGLLLLAYVALFVTGTFWNTYRGRTWADEVFLLIALFVTCVPIAAAVTLPFVSTRRSLLRTLGLGTAAYLGIGILVVPALRIIQDPSPGGWIGLSFVWPYLAFWDLGCELPLLPCGD